MQWKKSYDRRPLLTTVADKVKVREYVIHKLNKNVMPEILWTGKNPENILFEELPNSFVIKTNYGLRTNIIIKDKSNINRTNK
ncbi:ATP-grasp fold amidoligase family protein [Anaerosalibacter massiliensis]|uniref:ATP-grasp fold amidoligase family protein n=1 Tax=Anaerosalibacter massiliensis TaxID=1347392 RepID=UPI0011C8E835|nr:ATP-grasp fold amidoligase family protein [Anaerosalibacter massiliensis]